ncbi:MAG: TRAM domain-containing protein, partial [Coriobacteriales bacterium]|nr:TRAM domain-containing protein [Coriobacteriales bacterium]
MKEIVNQLSLSASQCLRIERLTNHGFGVGHAEDGKVVFVADSAPGDLVRVAFDEDHGNYSVAHIVELTEPSPIRVAPSCPFVATCGGCCWQHIAYEAQCTTKRTLVLDALERIAHFAAIRTERLVASCMPAPRPLKYRNKLELGAVWDPQQGFTLGFYRADSTRIATPERCLLAHEAIVAAPRALRGALRYAQGVADLGIYRVGMRHSERSGSLELALWTEPGIV